MTKWALFALLLANQGELSFRICLNYPLERDTYPVAEFIDYWLRDKVSSDLGLSCRHARLNGWRASTKNPLSLSPSQGSMNSATDWLLCASFSKHKRKFGMQRRHSKLSFICDAGCGWGGCTAVPGEEDHNGERRNRGDRRRQNHWRGNRPTVLSFLYFSHAVFFLLLKLKRKSKVAKNNQNCGLIESYIFSRRCEFSQISTKFCKFLLNFANFQKFRERKYRKVAACRPVLNKLALKREEILFSQHFVICAKVYVIFVEISLIWNWTVLRKQNIPFSLQNR